MKRNTFVLTKKEQEVMELLWRENRTLSRTDILELSIERSWKDSTIHILLNGLLNKGAIVVDGFVKTNKNFGRTYKASLTESEYQTMQFKNSSIYKNNQGDAVLNFMSTLFVEEKIDPSTMDKLQQLIKEKKEN